MHVNIHTYYIYVYICTVRVMSTCEMRRETIDKQLHSMKAMEEECNSLREQLASLDQQIQLDKDTHKKTLSELNGKHNKKLNEVLILLLFFLL